MLFCLIRSGLLLRSLLLSTFLFELIRGCLPLGCFLFRLVRSGLLLRTRDAGRFYQMLNRLVVEDGLRVDTVTPADADVEAVYQYLIDTPAGNGGRS